MTSEAGMLGLGCKAQRRRRGGQAAAWGRLRLLAMLGAMVLVVSEPGAFLSPAHAQERVKAEVAGQVANGFARLVFTFQDMVSPQVQVTNGIVVITTDRPIKLSAARVDRLPAELGASYLSAARVDPDGRGIRIGLGRKLTVNSMEAGEKLFIDLLPDGWRGLPPGLPQEVVDDLAKRAREAEHRIRQLGDSAKHQRHVVRLHLAEAPTFSRFAFDVPAGVEVLTHRDDTGYTVLFRGGDVEIEPGDTKGRLPPKVASLDIDYSENGAAVRLALDPEVDVRAFQEDRTFSVDVTPPKAARAAAAAAARKAQGGRPGAPGPHPPERQRGEGDAIPIPAPPATMTPPVVEAPKAEPGRASGDSRQAAAAPPATVSAAPSPAPSTAPEPVLVDVVPPLLPAPSPATTPAPTPAAAPASAPAPAPAPAAASLPAAAQPAPASASPAAEERTGTVVADMVRQGSVLKLSFPFAEPTAAAVFRRGEVLWLIFDSEKPIDVDALTKDKSGTFRDVQSTETGDGIVVRMRLARPWVVGAEGQGFAWTITLGDTILEPTQPIAPNRLLVDGRSVLSLPLEGAHRVHRLTDPDAGDLILAATAPGPTRGISRNQDYVEFSLIATTHGVAVLPVADDIAVDANGNHVAVSRPSGLVLSAPGAAGGGHSMIGAQPVALDPQLWGAERTQPFQQRQAELIETAADAGEAGRQGARLNLARFYLANGFAAEARGVLDTIIGDGVPSDDAVPYLMRSMAWMELGRNAEAMKDLAHPLLATSLDAAALRGIVHVHEGRWREARENFAAAAGVVGTLPIDMQRRMVLAATRAALEMGDFREAARVFAEFETIGVPDELAAEVAVLAGRIAEHDGKTDEALVAYERAERAKEGPAAAEARFRVLAARLGAGKISRDQAINELEGFTVMWRGDRTEAEALGLLGRLYVDANRHRDAFRTLEAATISHPTSDVIRALQQTMTGAFADLFLEQRGEELSALEALGIFYDYSELVPVGRRGDEMIRRLADRLISVDLLEQASELLQHQVDKRLQGAARAQVAAKLAMVQLKNRKPDKALRTLRATSLAELPSDIREQRLLLEARATSETGRHELALELLEGLRGKDVDRLRADILWAGKRYAESAEAIERAYGDRWQSFAPLADHERHDILKAAVGYALGDDRLGLDRFRSRYAAKMADSPDRAAFEAVSTSFGLDATDFKDIARAVSSVDSLDRFLRDYRARYGDDKTPEGGPEAPQPAAPPPRQSQAPAPARG
ncbi:tetratricopeptide repeat protein [Blastochloris tepida]|uniref:Uncharacterized protein n=1 Tax=Blastochloris tepida TaxID=2233851 RepID=A0A348FX20_9HYPH|nr:tetratricopeptide repeat protein [Blastochloris tepida]BBF91853.1 hypothetical protein BLTE_05380 [Blastochloris tepida]